MRFVDLLRAGALLGGVSATVLAGASVAVGVAEGMQDVVLICAGWWFVAATGTLVVGRKGETSQSVSRLLVEARPLRGLPEPRVGRVVANRLWPLGLATLLALIGTAAVGPQVGGIGAGFPLVWALLWRIQESAVKAVEERDGVAYYVKPSGPLDPIVLLRGPGLRRDLRVDPNISPLPRP